MNECCTRRALSTCSSVRCGSSLCTRLLDTFLSNGTCRPYSDLYRNASAFALNSGHPPSLARRAASAWLIAVKPVKPVNAELPLLVKPVKPVLASLTDAPPSHCASPPRSDDADDVMDESWGWWCRYLEPGGRGAGGGHGVGVA